MPAYTFHFGPVLANWPGLLSGVEITLLLSVTGMLGGLVLGLVAAVARLSPRRFIAAAAGAYIEFLRDTPMLVQLVWIYYCMPIILGVNLPALESAMLGLAVAESANVAEIIRAGILAVPHGQIEAANALGLRTVPRLRHVVLPQALRIMIPPLLNTYISLLKSTALVAIIAVPDLMFASQRLASETFRPIEVLTSAAVIYFVITFPIVMGVRHVERRLRIAR